MGREANKGNWSAERLRILVALGIVLFGLSTAFPVVASLTPASMVDGWIGVADVALAGVLLIAGVAADATARSRHKTTPASVVQNSYRAYRALAIVPLLLLVLFFLLSKQVRWEVLLPGLAWRAWLLMYILPSVLLLLER